METRKLFCACARSLPAPYPETLIDSTKNAIAFAGLSQLRFFGREILPKSVADRLHDSVE
jgi:hypothetical protein